MIGTNPIIRIESVLFFYQKLFTKKPLTLIMVLKVDAYVFIFIFQNIAYVCKCKSEYRGEKYEWQSLLKKEKGI